jgi:hypothetical protein
MTDSDSADTTDDAWISEQRVQEVKRWVEYIESNSPETWGPQQNAIVEAPLETTQHAVTAAVQNERRSAFLDESDSTTDA